MAIFGTILSALSLANEVKKSGVGSELKKRSDNAANNNFSSIAAKASEGILQFPVIISDNVDYDTAVTVTKALERSYSSFIQTIISMNTMTDDLNATGVSSYLNRIHDNSLSNVIDSDSSGDDVTINGFKKAIENSVSYEFEKDGVTFTCEAYFPEKPIMSEMLKKELGYYLEGLCLNKLNDKYQPVKLENASFAIPMFEAKGMNYNKIKSELKQTKKELDDARNANKNLTNKLHEEKMKYEVKKASNVELLPNDVRKANELQPTFIRVSIKRSVRDIHEFTEYNFIIGIKATLHLARSSEYITNLVDACEYKGNLFRFIKWSSGEISFLKDYVLRMDEFSKEAKGRVTNQSHWWEALKRRGREAKISKVKTNRLLPNASFVFTTEEVEYIKANFGYDLLNVSVAKRLMKEYFLLGYVVLDMANEVANILYDGQKNFQMMTFKNMEREGANAERQFKEILRATRRM